MANQELITLLTKSIEDWNKWRSENPEKKIGLRNADLRNSNLTNANLLEVNLWKANLSNAKLSGANLRRSFLRQADFSAADLSYANLRKADLRNANLKDANLGNANLRGANLWGANLTGVTLESADLTEVSLRDTDLTGANLGNARLRFANIRGANLMRCNLVGSDLTGADLRDSNLDGADLQKANLSFADLIQVNINEAKISSCNVYGVNVWDLYGEFKEQKELIITPEGESIITVDNIEVAQFIYLILNNKKIRHILNTLTSKTVLILGRFSIPGRKAILDALRNKLREYDLLPIVFDFERPTDKDFTETIKTLAGMCYFVIADITNPKSSPLELQAIVPDYQIPFVPIIQDGEEPFAMMADLHKKYNWVLKTKSYDSIDALKPGIIDPAIAMRNKLRLIKAQEQMTESLKDYLDKTL